MSSTLRYGQVIRIRSYEKANTFLTTKSYSLPHSVTLTLTSISKSITKKTSYPQPATI